jgi:hypothetical protein
MGTTTLDVRQWLLVLLCAVLGACAYAPTATDAEQSRARQLRTDPTKATVYVIRDQGIMGASATYPVAVNNRVVTWLAPQTYTMLLLEPGVQSLSSVTLHNLMQGFVVGQEQVVARRLEAGQVYFVRLGIKMWGVPEWTVDYDPSSATAAIRDHRLVAFDHRGLALNILRGQVAPAPKADPIQQFSSTSTSTQAAPASANDRQVAQALEAVATVLFIGLLIAGVAFAAGAGGYGAPVVVPPSSPPPAISVPRPLATPPATLYAPRASPGTPAGATVQIPALIELSNRTGGSVPSRFGDSYRVEGNQVYSPTSGVRWTVENDVIRGSDGSRFRISGNSIISSDGRSFERVGNELRSRDGSYCSIIGNQVDCRR